jgi:hypothetical protein
MMISVVRPFSFRMRRLSLLVVLCSCAVGRAGLYYSGETPNELPSQWRGFLIDHRNLRLIGVPPAPGSPLHLLREQYLDAASKLEETAKKRALTADEAADLGALHVRLGKASKGVEVLRKEQREHPEHFKIAANLGTAWQAAGDLNEASRALQEAVRLAPPRWRPFEEAQLKLVRLRLKEPKNASAPDDLFGVTFDKKPDPAVRKKLPSDDVAIVQQMSLWLPGDGRLLWLLGELANAHGDVRTAASILEGVVTEFAITIPEARERRKAYRDAADEIAKLPDSEHAKYRGDILFKSTRPIGRTLAMATLPAIRPDGVNPVPWAVISETVVDKPFRPRFHKHLQQLDGKKVSLTGFMQPITMDVEVSGFLLIEYPIGCWFCETPDPAGMLYIEIAGGKTVPVKRGRVKVEGTLKLNTSDPEEFLYTLSGATVRDPD